MSALFPVQIPASLSLYHMRFAGWCSAPADALAMLVPEAQDPDSIGQEAMERLAQVSSPNTLDFGRSPRTAATQVMETARSLVNRNVSGQPIAG